MLGVKAPSKYVMCSELVAPTGLAIRLEMKSLGGLILLLGSWKIASAVSCRRFECRSVLLDFVRWDAIMIQIYGLDFLGR